MSKNKLALGRGLASLIPRPMLQSPEPLQQMTDDGIADQVIVHVALDKIERNPYQPRADFDPAALDELKRSIQEKGIENFLRVVVPPKHEDYAVDLWQRTSHKIALWIKGQMLLGLIVAVLVYLVLSLIGIQYALLLALITGFLELIPYGFLIAMVPAIAFAYLSGGVTSTLMVAGAYLIIHQFEVYLLAPLIVRKVVGLSPLVVILAVLIGYQLAGVWGLILAIPVAVCLMELFSDIEKKKIFAKTRNETK